MFDIWIFEFVHIVINELYAWVPGLLGVEALFKNCVLVTAADENIETMLPEGSNKAWMVTNYLSIHKNLKILIKNKNLQKSFAKTGFEWATKHASLKSNKQKILKILEIN